MERTVISWVARTRDFIEGSAQVNPNGPNFSFHKGIIESAIDKAYSRHYIVYSGEAEKDRALRIFSAIKKEFPLHQVEIKNLNVQDPIDLREIFEKCRNFIMGLEEKNIDLFIGPGTRIMQLAWFLCYHAMPARTNLIQVRPAQFTPTKQDELLHIDIEKGDFPYSIILREKNKLSQDNTSHLLLNSLKGCYSRARQIASTEKVSTIIYGESGTGKEALAREIHQNSARHDKEMEIINCSALGDDLLESRLFGHKKGSFTGAFEDHAGILEKADGSTVFLDEIGDTSSRFQQLLLRFLQEGEIQPIGKKSKKVNVRVIVATHRNLEEYCEEGKFRWDLFYRLAVAEINIPPFRSFPKKEKREMINFLLKKKKEELNKPKKMILSSEIWDILMKHQFPGNIRELEHLLESLYVYSDGLKPQITDLPNRIINPSSKSNSLLLEDAIETHIRKVFELQGGVISKTVSSLEISENNLRTKLKKYKLIK